MPADTINRQLRGSFYRRNRLAFALAAAGALMGAVLNLIISWLMQCNYFIFLHKISGGRY